MQSHSNIFKVFIGFDRRQPIAFQVAAHSVWTRASRPVQITPLIIDQLPIDRTGLTGFTYSRFLVPFLSDYQGVSLFLDSDIIVLTDVCEMLLYPVTQPNSVHVVEHPVHKFERPSVMLFENEKCKKLTPDFVNDKSNNPFKFDWADSIGKLPAEYNFLVGYDEKITDPKIIHYTQGIPCWPETKDCDYYDLWIKEYQSANSTVSFQELMGRSVHAKPVYDRLKKAANAG